MVCVLSLALGMQRYSLDTFKQLSFSIEKNFNYARTNNLAITSTDALAMFLPTTMFGHLSLIRSGPQSMLQAKRSTTTLTPLRTNMVSENTVSFAIKSLVLLGMMSSGATMSTLKI